MADTLSLALTGLDASNPLPGTYLEVRFAQGASAGDTSPKRVLLIAPKTAAGSITPDTQVMGPFSDEADVVAAAGAGSPAHRMARRFLRICKNVELYLVCPAAATGSAAVDKLTLTGPATANGAVNCVFTGESFDVPFTQGQTASDVASAVCDAFNARTHLPVTASVAAAVVTLTGKIAGTELNTSRFRAKSSGGGIGITPTADTALGTSGAGGAAIGVGTCSYTNVLATILGRKFDYLVPHTSAATPLGDLSTQIDLQAEPTTGFRQKAIGGLCLDPSSAQTLCSGANLNRARGRMANSEENPEEAYVVAATVAAEIIKQEIVDPSTNFDGLPLPLLQRPYNDSALPTSLELKTQLNNGVCAIAFDDGGAAYLVRSVTTRCKQGSAYDYRARDSHVVAIADAFAADLAVRVRTTPWKKIARDPKGNQDEPDAKFCTPRRLKALVEQLLEDYLDRGYLNPDKFQEMLDSMQIGIDPLVPSRMNCSIPLYSCVLLHQHAMLIKESSAAT